MKRAFACPCLHRDPGLLKFPCEDIRSELAIDTDIAFLRVYSEHKNDLGFIEDGFSAVLKGNSNVSAVNRLKAWNGFNKHLLRDGVIKYGRTLSRDQFQSWKNFLHRKYRSLRESCMQNCISGEDARFLEVVRFTNWTE